MRMAAETRDDATAAPEGARTPMRRCVASGESLPRAQLLRFVVGPDDMVVPDLDVRLPGRGLWVTCRRDMVELACARNLFSRAARRTVAPIAGPQGEALAEWLDALLARRALDALAMARKAGRFVFGLARVGETVDRLAPSGSAPAVLLRACDAGADGRQASQRFYAGAPAPVVRVEAFDAAELGRVAGRDHVVHALVLPGGAARQVLRTANRLAVYRGVLPLDALAPDPILDGRADVAEDDVTDE